MLAKQADMTMKKEQLSALVDGELDKSETQAVARELRRPDVLENVELYYRIGEELRAESAKASLSSDFSKRLAARLETEPPLTAKVPAGPEMAQGWGGTPESMQPLDSAKPVERDGKKGQRQLAVPAAAL